VEAILIITIEAAISTDYLAAGTAACGV